MPSPQMVARREFSVERLPSRAKAKAG